LVRWRAPTAEMASRSSGTDLDMSRRVALKGIAVLAKRFICRNDVKKYGR
jgi:hypothetical protein